MNNSLGCGYQLFNRDIASRNALIRVQLVQLHIQANQVTALSRDDQNAAFVSGLNQRFEPNIRKIAVHQHIHHAPRMVGRITLQRRTNSLTHTTASTVTTHDVSSANCFYLALIPNFSKFCRVHPLKPCRHRKIIYAIRRTLQPCKFTVVMRHHARRRFLHDVQIEIMHTRLVQNHMWHVRQAVFHVLHPPATCNAAAVRFARLPKSRLIHPISFFQHAVCKTKGFEHFHRSTGNAVSLPQLQWARFLLHNDCANVWKGG